MVTMAKDSSPFRQTEFHNLGDIYTRKGLLFGLKKPNGEIIINFEQSTNYAHLRKIAKIINCEIVQVHGTWTFLPNAETRVVMDDEDEDGQYPQDQS